MKSLALLLSSLAVSSIVSAIDCPDNDHKVAAGSMPYWNPDDEFPCMYAGTLQASLDYDHNLFYWLIRSNKPDPSLEKKLIVWLNGGPGSSSIFALVLENGPLRITRTGDGPDDFLLGLTKDGSWTDLADVLYIDQPVGTGFSYGDTYNTRMQEGADDFARFMAAFV